MKDVLGAFNQLQKAYRKYCYQAVAPLGIKMSEMLCVLYLYNFQTRIPHMPSHSIPSFRRGW